MVTIIYNDRLDFQLAYTFFIYNTESWQMPFVDQAYDQA